jgi:hypothetical protein
VSDLTSLPSSTRPIAPELASLLLSLKPGQRIRITQTVRINCLLSWPATVEGVFRDVNFLATGLATDRVPEDDIVVVTVHFTKDNGELSSITLDESSRVEAIGPAPTAPTAPEPAPEARSPIPPPVVSAGDSPELGSSLPPP